MSLQRGWQRILSPGEFVLFRFVGIPSAPPSIPITDCFSGTLFLYLIFPPNYLRNAIRNGLAWPYLGVNYTLGPKRFDFRSIGPVDRFRFRYVIDATELLGQCADTREKKPPQSVQHRLIHLVGLENKGRNIEPLKVAAQDVDT